MNPSLALIVDDSKTAQHLLKRMLQKFHLRIDSVNSAEEALAYLSYNHPAVIFLDQQMTGMTGIEALRTIKANPHTALIPVIMYTSQKDDLFISQAVALGAQGIFSKSAMEHANLERVLQGLNIPLAEEDVPEAETATAAPVVAAAAVAPPAVHVPPALDQVRTQIARLFEIHIADVRQQINQSTQFIIKRLSSSVAANEAKPETKAAPRSENVLLADRSLAAIKTVVHNAVDAERQRTALVSNSILTVVLLGVIFFGYALWQIQSELEQASKNYQSVLELREKEIDKKNLAVSAGNAAMLRAVSWAQNADFQFNYGEPALADLPLSNLNKLVYLLAEGGYKGQLMVDVHFGNVCLEMGDKNVWRIARPEMPATSCKMLADLYPKFAAGDLATPAYQNFEKTALPLQDGRISIQLQSSGLSAPRVAYPTIRSTTTAAEWNRAALKNNRVAVMFPGVKAP
jgi:CheY-like chemotaxis protein